jgi:thiol-disulfide isomerase/thioredoxin
MIALLKRYPNDLFAHLRYQDELLPRYQLVDEIDRALELYRSMPDKNLSQFLEARLLWRSQVAKSRATLNRLLETAPAFPWPHLTLVEMMEEPGATGSVGAEAHLRSFLKACPNTLEAYAHFKNVKDSEMLLSGAAQLRRLLSVRTDAAIWQYYPSLWELEFRAARKEELEQARQRVRDDVKRLQTLEPSTSRYWNWTFNQASELAQDTTIRDWLKKTILTKLPNSDFAIEIAEEQWEQEHPRPSSAKPEECQKFNQSHFEATAEWLRRWPNSAKLVNEQWMDLRILPGLPAEKVMLVIDEKTELDKRHPEVGLSIPPFPIMAAEEYVNHKVRLDRVPAMLEEGLRQAEEQQKYQLDPELIPAETRALRIPWLAVAHYRAGIILADLYLLTKETPKAEGVLAHVGAELEARKPAETAPPQVRGQYRYEWQGYLQRLAQLEELEGKPQDALARYQEILRGLPRRAVEQEKLPYISAAKRLYLEQGGTPENWMAWATSPEKAALAEARLTFSVPIPEFAVADLAGRTWRLSDLKGKVTLLDFWATWCGSCRGELPHIQKLYDRLKGRNDLQVVTINVDDNPGLIEGYLKETNFTFPILPAKDLAGKIFPIIMLPQTWIVDAQGRRSEEQVVGGSDDWVERTIAQMERVRGDIK